jgi:hypothetical protein
LGFDRAKKATTTVIDMLLSILEGKTFESNDNNPITHGSSALSSSLLLFDCCYAKSIPPFHFIIIVILHTQIPMVQVKSFAFQIVSSSNIL